MALEALVWKIQRNGGFLNTECETGTSSVHDDVVVVVEMVQEIRLRSATPKHR